MIAWANITSWAEHFSSNKRAGTLNVAVNVAQTHAGRRPIPSVSLCQRHPATHGVSADIIRIDHHDHSPPAFVPSRVADEVAIRDVVAGNIWEKFKA